MRHWLAAAFALALTSPAFAQQAAPEIPFDSSTTVLQMPADMYLGEVAGVAVNSKKHIFVFHRGNVNGPAFGAAAAQLLEFGPDGKYVREIGKGLYAFAYAHTVRVDRNDNIWIVDKGSDMVVKFTPEGRVAMVTRPSHGNASIRRQRTSTGSSASRPTSRGTTTATSSSATATSTRASPSTTRTGTG
jgi:hypothetical protein